MSPPTWLGIDLGGTTIKWEHLADDGQALASGRVATPSTGHEAVTDTLATIIDAAGAGGVSGGGGAGGGGRPSAVGIAVPGHLSRGRDSITVLPNVPGDWLGYPVTDRLRALTGFTPTLLNDARAFGIAELELGAARDCPDVLFVTVGTGVGGALAVDGRVVRSGRDCLGEVGHITAVVDGRPCTCGSRGCVEAYAGGAQILRRAHAEGLDVAATHAALGELALAALTAELPARVLDEAYDALAVGVSTACAFTGAQVVVIGGGVAQELPGFLDRCRHRLADRHRLLGDIDVRACVLGVRAGALGAALSARAEATTRTGTPADTVEQIA